MYWRDVTAVAQPDRTVMNYHEEDPCAASDYSALPQSMALMRGLSVPG